MPTDDLNNIKAKLNFSKRLGGLIKGHQQEMQQVLDENEDLQMLVEQLLKENAILKSQLAEEKTKNTLLHTEIEQLRNRPIQLLLMHRGRRENVSKFAYVYIFLYLCSAK